MTMQQLLECLPQPPDFAWNWPGLLCSPLGAALEKLRHAQQNPRWHGEGDVWAHTQLVCEALSRQEAFHSLDDRGRQVLALAALLHDIGKISATRLEDGCWVSPGHSISGAQMARELLWKEVNLAGTPDAMRMRESICTLIRLHMIPVHILDRDEPERQVVKMAANGMLAEYFTMERLCMLAEADVRGRVADDTEEMVGSVQLCRQLAEEAGCLRGPAPFADDYTMRAFFRGRSVWPGQSMFDDTWGEATILCGLPGTGKDTWIAGHGRGMPVISLDDIRQELDISPKDPQGAVAHQAREEALRCLRARQPFIWNATNLTESMRHKLIDLCERYGAAVRIVYLETGWEENLRRNAGRTASVPEHVICRMLGKLVPPQRWEAQKVEWHCV